MKDYITYLKSEQKSIKTINEYVKYATQMLSFINKPVNEITYMDLIEWKSSISHLSSNSVCLQIAAIKKYFEFLVDTDVINNNPSAKLKRPTKKAKEKPYMTKDMVKAMIDNATNFRDKAILLVFATTGLRVSELVGLTLDQYKNMGGIEHREIKILGKGSKERTIYINDETKKAIDKYLLTRPTVDCDKLFLSFQGGDIHSNNLSQTLKTIAKRANIPFWSEISNHTLRAAFATIQSESGTPVATIQAAMGHSSLNTTSVYIKHSQNNINNAIKSVVFD